MREGSIRALSPHGFHRVRYVEWGDADNPSVLFCAHGLTRNGRDFDRLAQVLSAHYRVICPDVAGRGASEWLSQPFEYVYPTYLTDMAALIARCGAEQVDWLGTSMGGLIGMMLAAQPGTPIRRLVMNDVGPFIPQDAVARIASYVGTPLEFDSREDFERYAKVIWAPFGVTEEADWSELLAHSGRALGDGRWTFNYDPAIAMPFAQMAAADVDLWPLWDSVHCPVLLLRGESSDILPRPVAEQMTRRGPCAQLVEFHGCGHAPALMSPTQIAAVHDWLLGETD
ncbi:alpha/beta fold hydrolase [Plasticicumulans acidivorans]|uniref:Pimeloyl-ACP methyl ester carboxylesterase n=1 Tax=Plasticicumulans acidivorans TaxID=886464 RepID=A0A317MYB0_9GAMM|nr:alpha/beta hydrolase [Plasticicumulans acidivorans]PWV63538.1 pimeloyl-ACP methyl ester carboxylesterase [Plasticicumulans acidivorans]